MSATDEYRRLRQILFDREGIQPQSKMVSVEGPVEKIHYLEIGRGKPLVLIHGGGSHSSEWINILKPLSKKYHLFIPDRPGCGLTDSFDYSDVDFREHAVKFVGSFMSAVGLDKASFLGQSMGGYFSICYAMQFRERVDKLLLIGAPAGMNLWIPLVLRLLGARRLNRFLIKTVAKPSVKNVKNVHKQILVANVGKLSDDYLEHCYYGQLLPGNETGFLSLLENVLTFTGWRKDLYIGDKLDQLKIPVRFIWGDKDAFESPATGRPKTLVVEDCKFEIVKNAGHSPWLDQPEECISLIEKMLKY